MTMKLFSLLLYHLGLGSSAQSTMTMMWPLRQGLIAAALCFHATRGAAITANVLAVHNPCVMGPRPLSLYWAQDMERKKSVLGYPVNITVEAFDTQCNSTLYRDWLLARVSDTTLPPLSLIIGPDNDGIQYSCGVGALLNIPVLTGLFFPSSYILDLPTWMPTGFAQVPPSPQFVTSAIDAFSEAGAKTIVTVAIIDPVLGTVNEDICFGGGREYGKSRGFIILGSFNFTRPGVTEENIRGLVRKIRDELKPDVLMWCDYGTNGDVRKELNKDNVLPFLKSENYLPKALFTMGLVGSPSSSYLREQGLLQYVTSADLWSPILKGRDYTQEDNPYSNFFRPNVSVETVVDNLNTGAIDGRPSSNELFVLWYKSHFGSAPAVYHTVTWAGFDVAESALYRAAKYRDPRLTSASQHLTGFEVMTMLQRSSQRGVYGLMRYNSFRINDAAPSITLQDMATSGVSDIVSPKSLQTKQLVYPMPSWDERVYEWKRIKDSKDRAALNFAMACVSILIALAFTAIVYRANPEVRMLDYGHIVLMCLASALACFGLALFWQGDVNQSQCDTYLWVVHLPLSFVIQLSNMKAHRLSVFLRLNGMRSKRPFTHAKVMGYTLLWLSLTVAVLVAVIYVDTPKATRFIEDPLRPKFDHYECKTGAVGDGLLYGLFAVHFAVSIATTIAVRNGSETFRDGTVIKESFILFYTCVAFAFMIERLKVGYAANFFIRTVFVALGITLLNFRLLFQRCVRHWIPQTAQAFITSHCLQPMHKYVGIVPGGRSSVALDESCIIYPIEIPADNKLDDLYEVFRDPARLAMFSAIADKLHITENVEFISEVLSFKQLNADSLQGSTVLASTVMRQRAQDMFEKYGRVGADREINISHALNRNLEKFLVDWDDSASFMSHEAAERALDKDVLMRNKVFDAALKEVATMLYQNMWTKFVEKETELHMGADPSSKKKRRNSVVIIPSDTAWQ